MRVKTRSMEETVLCGMFTALIAAGAFIKISIPVQPFPMHFTMQFFFVLLSGFLLGKRMGALSVLCYLAIGLSGVPVFAAGGGMAYLIRPTFGFLLGFFFTAFVTGLVSERMRGGSFAALLTAAFCGLLAMYASGMIYFYVISNFVIRMPVTWGIVFVNCFLLTVGGDLLLCVLAALAAARIAPVLRQIR